MVPVDRCPTCLSCVCSSATVKLAAGSSVNLSASGSKTAGESPSSSSSSSGTYCASSSGNSMPSKASRRGWHRTDCPQCCKELVSVSADATDTLFRALLLNKPGPRARSWSEPDGVSDSRSNATRAITKPMVVAWEQSISRSLPSRVVSSRFSISCIMLSVTGRTQALCIIIYEVYKTRGSYMYTVQNKACAVSHGHITAHNCTLHCTDTKYSYRYSYISRIPKYDYEYNVRVIVSNVISKGEVVPRNCR